MFWPVRLFDDIATRSDHLSHHDSVDFIKKGHIKRTLVCVSIIFIQNACGNSWIICYISYFMQLGSLSVSASFDASVGMSGIMVIGNICGWFLVEKFGRRGTAM